MKTRSYFLYLIPLIFLCSCGHYVSENKLDSLVIGMKKSEVQKTLKGNGSSRGTTTNKYGKLIEIKEYQTSKFVPFQGRVNKTYWLYFCNGQLYQWGRAGDWKPDQRQIFDINLKSE